MKRIAVVFIAIFMIAALASAQHGPGPGERGPGREGGPGGHATVGSDGTIYIESVSNDTLKITAVRPAGTVAWTATLSTPGHVTLSDGNLIVESASRPSDGAVTTTLTAVSTASGATAWTKTITGHVELFPFSAGTYAIVSLPPATSGGTPTRSLIGISNGGSTLFTLAL
jgi:hypothetical protein